MRFSPWSNPEVNRPAPVDRPIPDTLEAIRETLQRADRILDQVDKITDDVETFLGKVGNGEVMAETIVYLFGFPIRITHRVKRSR